MADLKYTDKDAVLHRAPGLQEAIAIGAPKYMGDRPCARGHTPIRYTKSRMCCECCFIRNNTNIEERKRKAKERYMANAEELKRKRRQYVKDNYEKVKAKKKQHRLDNIEKYKEKERKYYWDNREKCNARSRDYNRRTGYCKKHYMANREYRNAYSREYGKRNPEIYRSKHARRRSILKQGVSGPEFRSWVRQQKKVCHWCGIKCPNDFHVDHYVSLSKGGKHELDNIVIACRACNLSKHAKDPHEFAKQLGRLF